MFCKFVTFKDYCDNASQIQEQRCMFTEIKRDQLLFLNMKKRPDKVEQPGPPVSQTMRGSSFDLFSDSMK
jgi:hypothetical protein